MKSIRFILGLITLAALGLTAADSGRAQSSRPEVAEEFHQTYPLSATGRVSLSNINGSVRISAWDRSEVKVDAVKRAYTQERLREAEIKVSANSNAIEIETEYPDYRWDGRNGERHENPASVEYTLTIPRNARVEEINLVNGGLDIEGLGGPVHASSVNGKVVARGLSGPVNLSVVNGRLEAALDGVGGSGSVNLSAVNGPLVATLPSDSNATVHADTVHGSISNDFNLPVRVGEYVGRELAGRLGQGGTRVSLNNVNGSIQIKRAADGKSPSAVTNLLSETRDTEDFDDDDDDDADDGAREAERELREGKREAERDRREAGREAERDRANELRDAQREIERATRDAERNAAKISKEAEKAAKDVEKSLAKGDFGRGFGDDSRRITARETKSYQVSGSPRVRVETFDGAVTVHAWDKNEVSYTAIKRAWDEKEMKGVTVEAQGSGSEVTLRAKFDKSFAHSYHEHDGRVTSYSSNADVEFDVYVPRNAVLFVSSGDGRLRVEGVNGELDLHTGDGTIDVTGSRGRLKAETGDGRIRVDDFEGDADARTGDGRISLDGNFRSLSARTGDGTISLALPEGSNATIETNAESVSNDGVAVAETPDAETRVRRWRIGGGGQTFTLRTGDGRIILRRR
ncbi:MAG TPA: DUF4097 family beta strand repeat-containing protein [Pyrinomonadaceae bacterium]|jgi:DUF4097 and DUF4098 domain-containing protein YvlB|nr:DUF4097 family beta strand repeat-containing protein [Pyrinomonadaceae bacterium]